MLTRLDESLLHQAPLPFSSSVTSDHRFYDRCWVGAYDPAGGAALNFGLGVYKNMNTLDGFLCCVRGSAQRNVRVSRPLGDRMDDLGAGPLRYEVIEPYQHLRVRLDPTGGLACELDWRARVEPFVESPTVSVINGRVATNVQRYDQVGSVDGWIAFGDDRIDLDNWFGARDHSWGVRGGVGGFEPVNGPSPYDGGFFISWFVFLTERCAGYVQHNRDREGAVTFSDGVVRSRRGASDRRIVSVEQVVDFPAGSRCYSSATMRLLDDAGEEHAVECRRLTQPIVMRGAGYDGGYLDGRGLGVYRGDLVEYDEYDLAIEGRPSVAGTPDPVPGVQREQPVSVVFDGEPGVGDLTILAVGELPFLGRPIGTQR